MFEKWSKGLKTAVMIAALGLSGCNMFGGDDDDHRDRNQPKATPKAGSSQLNKADAEFMQTAASAGQYEVMSSELASSKASSNDVKQFAGRMIADHTKANSEQRTLANKKSLVLPEVMLPRHKQMYDRLKNLSGKEFDTAYINQQTQAHNEAVNLFEKASRDSTDPEVKAWAKNTLPVLQQHQQHVAGLRKQ
jgi:putative membrane protein